MPPIAYYIAAAACGAAALAGISLWIAAILFAVWAGSLYILAPQVEVPSPPPPDEFRMQDRVAPLIEALQSPLILLDETKIAAANKAARTLLGEHVVGEDARVALRHPEAVRLLADDTVGDATIKGLISPRAVWTMAVKRIDPRYRIVELSDQTAQADISRAHTDFVANASHELRTPLSAIIGYVETLADNPGKVDAKTQARFLETMGREARRMQNLVEDLMSLSRVEAEKHDAPQDRVDLASVVKAVAKDVNAIQGQDRIQLELADLPADVPGEHAQLDQLVRNLIDNAIKYGHADTPITVRIVAAPSNRVTLEVEDRGPGIAAEHIPYLTRRFYRTDPGRSRASGGTGLGLAIVKHIVERHRGQLDIASEIGRGTTVSVRLPRFA